MRSAIIIFLVASTLCVNARVIKRHKKIARALQPRGCHVPDLPGFKSQAYGSLGTCGCPDPLGCSGACGCSGTCGANGCPGYDYRGTCGCQSIFLEELPCNYGSDGYGILSAEISNYDRIPVIRLPQTLGCFDAGIPVPAINLPTCQCNIPNCQCQRTYQMFDAPCNRPAYEFLDAPRIMKYPVETVIRTVVIEPAPRLPNCGCQSVDVCGCQRQKCGCQLTELDVPCICQPAIGSSCGCPLSALGMPCGCQLPVPSLPFEYQLPSLDCGCQSPCGCQPVSGTCGCQLPVPNVPYAYYLPSSEIPYAYQMPASDLPCSCQLPSSACQLACGGQLSSCGCQLPCSGGELPSCGCQYLRQVTLQPPFL